MRSRGIFVIGLGSTFDVLLLVISWKWGRNIKREEGRWQSLIISWQFWMGWFWSCGLVSWAGCYGNCGFKFYCHMWSGQAHLYIQPLIKYLIHSGDYLWQKFLQVYQVLGIQLLISIPARFENRCLQSFVLFFKNKYQEMMK